MKKPFFKTLCLLNVSILLSFSFLQAQELISRDGNLPVKNVVAVNNNTNVSVTWEEPSTGTPSIFRYDSGIASGQLGFTGEAPHGVVGSCHRVNAEIEKVQWYLTNFAQINPTHVNIYIFDLDNEGMPTTNIIYSVLNVPTTVMEWCEYEFPIMVSAPNGFFVALSRTSGSNLALGTSKPTEEWQFQPNTHFYSPDFETTTYSVVTQNNFNINFMIRAEGYSLGKSAHFGYPVSKSVSNYRIYRLIDGQQNNESSWTILDENVSWLSYTDNGWNSVSEGIYRWAVKAEYSEGLSIPKFSNILTKDLEFSFTINLTTNSGDPVTDAVIELKNKDGNTEHVYTKTVTEATVIFQDVWKGTYDILINLDGFYPYSKKNFVINGQGLSHDATLEEIAFQVVNPTAELTDNNVVISWKKPAFKEFIQHCVNDEIAMVIGWDEYSGSTMTAAIRFTPSDLQKAGIVSGFAITKIALGLGTHLNYINAMDIRIWEGGSSLTDAGLLVYNQTITDFSSLTEVAINEIVLTTPYIIDVSKELRIGYRIINTAGFPFGLDEGPIVSQKGGLMFCSGISSQWLDINTSFKWNYNWVLKAFVSSDVSPEDKFIILDNDIYIPTVSKVKNISLKNISNTAASEIFKDDSVDVSTRFTPISSEKGTHRSPENYIIYRLEKGKPESTWELLSDNLTELVFIDTNWNNLPDGVYQWAIKTKYTSGNVSLPRLTNQLAKNMEVAFTVNLTTDSGEPVEGAVVVLTNQNGNSEYIYTDTATGSSLKFPVIWKGTYKISVSLKGFHPYSAINIVINGQGLSCDVKLEEIRKPVTSLIAEISGNDVSIKWKEPNSVTIFRHDSGINNQQIGFENGTNKSVIGSLHKVGAELKNISWYFTEDAVQTSVDLFIFSLNSQGTPNRNNVIFSAKNIPNAPLQWCTYELPNPVSAPNGFFIGLSATSGGFLSLGTDAPNSEYPFKYSTHFYSSDYTQFDFAPFENSNILKNVMVRAEGFLTNKGVHAGYEIFRLRKDDPEGNWTSLSNDFFEVVYTDKEWSTLSGGLYQWAVKANYLSGQSDAILSNILDKPVGIEELQITNSEFQIYPNPVENELQITNYELRIKNIEIHDVCGRKQNNSQFSILNSQLKLYVSHLSSGIYFVTIEIANGEKVVHKMIKK